MFGVRYALYQRPFGSLTFEEIQAFLLLGFLFLLLHSIAIACCIGVWRGFRNGRYHSVALLNPTTLCPWAFVACCLADIFDYTLSLR
jgi:hypothetical protein